MSGGAGGAFALFRVAAGPRVGHGHLRRAEALAQALGRPSCVSIRGAGGAVTRLPIVTGRGPSATLDAVAPSVLVIDDPVTAHGAAWCRAAARRAVPVVSLHDLGIARIPSLLAVDGSVGSPARGWTARGVARGLRYAVIRRPRRARRANRVRRVLVSLGGGPRTTLAAAIVHEIARRWPAIDLVTPHVLRERAGARPDVPARHVAAPDGLARLLAQVDVAILGGGVSLYEAIAAGVPSIALAVVPAQRPTIRGFARLDLAVDGGRAGGAAVDAVARRVADHLARVIDDDSWRASVREAGPRAVDGKGAARVARAILDVVRCRVPARRRAPGAAGSEAVRGA